MIDEPLHAWRDPVTTVASGTGPRTRAASAAERAEVMQALELLALDRLEATYRIHKLGTGTYRLTGQLDAVFAQACVISLEPVAARLTETFDVEYRTTVAPAVPTAPELGMPGAEIEALSAPEIEPVVDGAIDVGRIVFEQLAAALPPYPRRPDAVFEPAHHGVGHDQGVASVHPFAKLGALKTKR